MRNLRIYIFFTVLYCLTISAVFAQQKKSIPAKGKASVKTATKTPAKKTAPTVVSKPKKSPVAAGATAKSSAKTNIPAEISDAEWSSIVNAFNSENWTQAADLCSAAFGKLKTENDKKQMAQLRYFYLFALAGKAANNLLPTAQLEEIADGFIGKEFLMPSRQLLSDCTQKVNYICPSKSDDSVLRVTATNKDGSEIHWFEYIKLPEKFDVAANTGKSAFVGGVLRTAEINGYKQNISILRLVFDRGFVNIVASR